ncbi:MAG: methyltransferase domain-containing protein [Pseudomonadota bacterium]
MVSQSKKNEEKRQAIRVNTEGTNKYFIEIPLTVPRGVSIKKEIVDISTNGLSFVMPEEEGKFLVGTPLENVVVYADGKKLHYTKARVTYIEKKYSEGIDYRIGIEFFLKENLLNTKRVNTTLQTEHLHFRLPRYNLKHSDTTPNIMITWESINGTDCSYEVSNISKYGLAFRIAEIDIKNSDVIRIGEILKSVRVFVAHRKVYEGRAAIVNIREQDNELVAGIELETLGLDIDKIYNHYNVQNTINDITRFVNCLPIGDKISSEFKEVVADMRYFLESIEVRLKKEENQLAQIDAPLRRTREKSVLNAAFRPFSNTMDNWIKRLNAMSADFDREKHENHKHYFQKQLHNLLLQSPYIRRSVDKPFGYSGDYIVLNMIYDNDYNGDTLLGKLLTKQTTEIDASKVVRLRKDEIKKSLAIAVQHYVNSNKKFKILSVGCGPAREIEEFIKEGREEASIDITLLDFDANPLYYAEERLSKQKKKPNISISFWNTSLRKMLREKQKNHFDYIYTLGLTDYLSDRTCMLVIKTLFGWLRPEGTLMVGQYTTRNSSRSYMEFAGEWYLVHREPGSVLAWMKAMGERCICDSYTLVKENYVLGVAKKEP